ncbi:hypothetical protein ACQJBY_031013 [Aegilops geniculata]
MWIAEGFIQGNVDRLEELGIEYHKELIERNLIEPDTSKIGQYVCNMHDVIRSFAQFVARNESLVAHDGEAVNSKLGVQSFLRLSIETKGVESDNFEWRFIQKHKSLRMLILIGCVKIQPSDSLSACPSLRVLHIESANFAALVGSMDQLKHLRYFAVKECDGIETLPENIHNLKFLQHISLDGCKNLVELPDSIVQLRELRYLDIDGTQVNSMPRGFSALTNLRSLWGFQTNMHGDWCSLEELGPLSQLRIIGLMSLKNVSDASFAMKARLAEKKYLHILELCCNNRRSRDGGLVKDVFSERDQSIIEEVFCELYPPPSIEDIRINGYFGRHLPRWIMRTATTPLGSLRLLKLEDLALCTQLPDGLCQLPCLESLMVDEAPMIKHVGPEFVQPQSNHLHPSSHIGVAFPRLHTLTLNMMEEWEEWEWEEEVHAMPVLEELFIQSCKLRCSPPGLASHARFLKKLTIYNVQGFQSVEDFASVVELNLGGLPDLTRISNFPKLQKLEIYCCRKLESLQEMDALWRLELTVQYSERQLPSFLQTVKPSHLLLDCWSFILISMALGKSSSEWAKFSHIQHVEAYANVDGTEKSHHLFYTREPYNVETNIDLQAFSDAVRLLQLWGEDGLPRLAALMESADEDEEDADNPEKIEEESMGQGREE